MLSDLDGFIIGEKRLKELNGNVSEIDITTKAILDVIKQGADEKVSTGSNKLHLYKKLSKKDVVIKNNTIEDTKKEDNPVYGSKVTNNEVKHLKIDNYNQDTYNNKLKNIQPVNSKASNNAVSSKSLNNKPIMPKEQTKQNKLVVSHQKEVRRVLRLILMKLKDNALFNFLSALSSLLLAKMLSKSSSVESADGLDLEVPDLKKTKNSKKTDNKPDIGKPHKKPSKALKLSSTAVGAGVGVGAGAGLAYLATPLISEITMPLGALAGAFMGTTFANVYGEKLAHLTGRVSETINQNLNVGAETIKAQALIDEQNAIQRKEELFFDNKTLPDFMNSKVPFFDSIIERIKSIGNAILDGSLFKDIFNFLGDALGGLTGLGGGSSGDWDGKIAIMGDHTKGDVGVGTDHYHIEYIKDGKKADPTPILSKLVTGGGVTLDKVNQTSKYGENRGSYIHSGVDFGINGSFGGKDEHRDLYLTEDLRGSVTSVTQRNQSGRAGYYTIVTLNNGDQIRIMHQNKGGAEQVVNGFNNASKGSTSSDSNSSESKSSNTGGGNDFIALGDSIAVGTYDARHQTRISGTQMTEVKGYARGGASSRDVLGFINSKSSSLRGQKVVLSTGATNDSASGSVNYKNIEQQIKALKDAGVRDIVVLPVASNLRIRGQRKNAEEINRNISAIASKYGAKMAGSWNAGGDGLHASQSTYLNAIRQAGMSGKANKSPSSPHITSSVNVEKPSTEMLAYTKEPIYNKTSGNVRDTQAIKDISNRPPVHSSVSMDNFA